MEKVYRRINWENEPSTASPINEENLNKMDYALDKLDDRVVELESYKEDAELNAESAEESAKTAKSYAVGDTGTRVGEDTDNAKYYAEAAKRESEMIKSTSEEIRGYVDTVLESENNAKLSASDASSSASDAERNATSASTSENNIKAIESNLNQLALTMAEYATATERNAGSAEASAGEAKINAEAAETSANEAGSSKQLAEENATMAESYTHGGTGTRPEEDTDNARYYMEQAKAASAGQVQADWNETDASEPSYIRNKPGIDLPEATAEKAGKMKLFDTTGANEDGAMTQKATTEILNNKANKEDVDSVKESLGQLNDDLADTNKKIYMPVDDDTDFNELTETGTYKVWTLGNAPVISDAPVPSSKCAYMVTVYKENDQNITQHAQAYYGDNNVYTRSMIRGVWNDWVQLGNSKLLSDAYQRGKTYTVGEYCINNNQMWKCKVQCQGQTPSEGTYWTARKIGDEIKQINSDLSKTNNNLNSPTQILGNLNNIGEGSRNFWGVYGTSSANSPSQYGMIMQTRINSNNDISYLSQIAVGNDTGIVYSRVKGYSGDWTDWNSMVSRKSVSVNANSYTDITETNAVFMLSCGATTGYLRGCWLLVLGGSGDIAAVPLQVGEYNTISFEPISNGIRIKNSHSSYRFNGTLVRIA